GALVHQGPAGPADAESASDRQPAAAYEEPALPQDPLPAGVLARLGTARYRPGSAVYSVAFSPDGKLLATGSSGDAVRVWDSAAGAVLPACRGHRGEVWSVACSPDGKTLASAGADGSVRLWDAGHATELHQVTGHAGEVKCVAFSPDGKLIASAGADRTVRL